MRTIAIIANLMLLAAVGFTVARGQFALETEDVPLFISMLAAPILSIVALLLRGVGSKDWLSRRFERMAMEERRKLEMLRLQSGEPGPAPRGGLATLAGNSGATERPPSVN